MREDDDLARLLPNPPPPWPDRRDAAITAAMQRFDGTTTQTRMPMAGSPGSTQRRWWKMPTAQIGALASVVLVAVIGLSTVMHAPVGQLDGQRFQPEAAPATPRGTAAGLAATPDAPTQGPPTTCMTGDCAAATRGQETAPPSLAVAEPAGEPGTLAPPAMVVTQGRLAVAREDATTAAPPAPAPPPAPPQSEMAYAPRAPAGRALAAKAIPAPAALAERVMADEDASDNIVVTGSKRTRSRRPRQRDDWNACTVDDPDRTLRACKRLGVGGARGAGADMSEGLTLAWEGDWDGAADAFSRAIALKPRFAIAYLNRGLAYRQAGDLARAAADLDLAVKYDPVARSYYNRALVRRDSGDVRGARSDAARAVQLDSRYPDAME